MKFLLQSYNSKIKDAGAKYFSEIITSDWPKPSFLFKTIDGWTLVLLVSLLLQKQTEKFLTFYLDKIEYIGSRIQHHTSVSGLACL